MNDVPHSTSKIAEIEDNVKSMSSAIVDLEHRVAGLETVLDLRLLNLHDKMDSRNSDRAELIDRIKTLEKSVSNITVDVAKLLGKWSIIMLVLAGLLSLLFSSARIDTNKIPEVLPPKVELKLNRASDDEFLDLV